MNPTLVILAAGIGSRYGGLKQLEKVGPGGAALMDYTIYDALQTGIDRVVVVVQRKNEEAVRKHLEGGAGRKVDLTFVQQNLHALPEGFVVTPGRSKPWGTGQALLAAAPLLENDDFIVANADDLYGRKAIAALDDYLDTPSPDGLARWAMVGYRLGDTLPPTGEVSRALCIQDVEGYLVDLEEIPAIRRDRGEAVWADAAGKLHHQPLESLVSMNLWGFTNELLRHLEKGFAAFLDDKPSVKDEYYLPKAVAFALGTGNARVAVLPADERWCGMTSPEDREITEAVLADLVDRGVYPQRLWE